MTEPVSNPYKLVPVKPTLAMILAATDNCSPVEAWCSLEPDHAREIWEAMLAASPQGEGSSADNIGHELIAFANQIEGASHDARAAAVQFFAERIARRVTEGVKP